MIDLKLCEALRFLSKVVVEENYRLQSELHCLAGVGSETDLF